MKGSILFAVLCLALILAACQPAAIEPTTTPEVFIPLEKAIPDPGIILEGVHLQVTRAALGSEFPSGCTGESPSCTHAANGSQILAVTLAPRDLPKGNMLAYKNLPDVKVVMEGGASVAYSLRKYSVADGNLVLGFEVPADARVFGLRWGDLPEVALNVESQ